MNSDQWAGVVFALLVVVPAAFLPKFIDPGSLLHLRYSPWILGPIIGGMMSGWISRRRLITSLVAGLAGYSGFWCAATWGAGSKATSVYETLVATGVGVLPVFLLYGLCKRATGRRIEVEMVGKRDQGLPFRQIAKRFWKQVLLFGGAFVVLTVVTVSDLNALESGAVESVRLWAPIASFYERFGYWPAVLLVPFLGLFCGWALCWSLMTRGTIAPDFSTTEKP